MNVTSFSFILLPLCALWIMTPVRLLELMVVASIFEAAAALTVGDLGIQPGLLPALEFLGFVGLQLLLGARFPGERQVWRLLRPFAYVAIWALASSFLMPRLFEDKAYVWPQKAAAPFVLTALAPNPANINQDIYLTINCALVVFAAMFLTRSRLSLARFMRAYLISGFLAAAVAVWQFANKVAGVPYPDDLFYSNPGWAILTTQQIGVVPRINGSFSEPAALAVFMSSIVCSTGWLMLRGNRDRMVRVLFGVGLLTMCLSTSTTGFAVLALIAVAAPIFALFSGSTRMMSALLRIGLPLLLLVALGGAAATTFVPGFDKNVSEVLTATLNKQDSSSYEDRTSADVDSLVATLDTYGLGVGWGSNRSSSLVPGLLAGLGVPGMLGLLWFAVSLTGRVRVARRRLRSSRDGLLVIDGCCGALIGFLLPASLSAPTITSVTFFFLLALLVACVARVEVQARSRPPAMAAIGQGVLSGPAQYRGEVGTG